MGVDHGFIRVVVSRLRLLGTEVDVETIDLERRRNGLPIGVVVQEVEDAFPEGAPNLRAMETAGQSYVSQSLLSLLCVCVCKKCLSHYIYIYTSF